MHVFLSQGRDGYRSRVPSLPELVAVTDPVSGDCPMALTYRAASRPNWRSVAAIPLN